MKHYDKRQRSGSSRPAGSQARIISHPKFRQRLLGLAIAIGATGAIMASTTQLALSAAPPVMAGQPAAAVLNPALPLPSFANLVAKARPAVVNVSVTPAQTASPAQIGSTAVPDMHPGSLPSILREYFERHGYPAPQGAQPGHRGPQRAAVGSGFIIDAKGWVVTNQHVVDGAGEITVTLQDGRKFPAKVQGTDVKTDLALLRITADEQFPTLKFGDSDAARVGDWVLAVGNPFGLGGSVSAGIVSARGRDIGSGPFDNFIQVDAPINRGNSGGPLFNARGEVIGINTAIYSPSGGSVGIGFAIPSNLAAPLISELREHGQVARGWLGVQIQGLDEDLAEGLGLTSKTGALVSRVLPDTPAARARLKTGDVIRKFAGTDIGSAKDLTRAVAQADVGQAQSVELIREGQPLTVTVTLSSLPGAQTSSEPVRSHAKVKGARLGVSVAQLDPRSPDTVGLRVGAVSRSGPAARSGIRAGDILLQAGMRDLKTTTDLQESVAEAAEGGKPLVLLVQRERGTRFVAVDITAS